MMGAATGNITGTAPPPWAISSVSLELRKPDCKATRLRASK
eukprot:gene13759-9852_t